MFKAIMGFLFGKPPQIFDQDGNVRHQFPKEKWQAWDNRFHSREYDWRHHKGMERGRDTNINAPEKKH